MDREKLRRVATALQERIDDPDYHAAFSGALHDYRVETEPSVAIALLDALEAAESERDRLRNLLDCRPALNSGVIEAYAKWTGVVYDSDAARKQ